MPYALKVLNVSEYEKVANRYPVKIRNRIRDSWGFTDTKRKVSFVRNRRKKVDLADTAIHEILELVADVSPHEEAGLRFKGKKPEPPALKFEQPPAPTYSLSPEEKWMWENISQPYLQSQFAQYKDIYEPLARSQYEQYKGITEPLAKSQYAQYKDVFEPSSRQIGGLLQADLTQPLQLPEETWQQVWQKNRERALSEFPGIERRLSQQLAGTGGLDTSGQAKKVFRDIEFAKFKTVEDLAIDQAIAEWSEKKAAKQSSYENMFRYLGYTPQFSSPQFNAPSFGMPQSEVTQALPTITPGRQGELNAWQQLGTWFVPPMSDYYRTKGYGVSAPGTLDTLRLATMGIGLMQ